MSFRRKMWGLLQSYESSPENPILAISWGILCWDQEGLSPELQRDGFQVLSVLTSPLCLQQRPVLSVAGTSTANIHPEAARGVASCWMLRIELNQGRRRGGIPGRGQHEQRERRETVWCVGKVRHSLMLLQAVKMGNEAGRVSPAKSCKPRKANIIRPNTY